MSIEPPWPRQTSAQGRFVSGGILSGAPGAAAPAPALLDDTEPDSQRLGLPQVGEVALVVFRKADTVAMILYGDLGTPDIHALHTLVQDAAAKLS
jgi:hypothetical protein